MDAGQMIAAMQQTPATAVVSLMAEMVSPDGKNAGTFAGLMQQMSAQNTGRVMPVETTSGSRVTTMPEVNADVSVTVPSEMMAAFWASGAINSSNIGMGPVEADKTDADKLIQEGTVDTLSQNVTLDANSAEQLALVMVQVHGRMPEQGASAASMPEPLAGTMSVHAGLEESLPATGAAIVSRQISDMAMFVTGVPPVETAMPVQNVAAMTNQVAVVTERDNPTALNREKSRAEINLDKMPAQLLNSEATIKSPVLGGAAPEVAVTEQSVQTRLELEKPARTADVAPSAPLVKISRESQPVLARDVSVVVESVMPSRQPAADSKKSAAPESGTITALQPEMQHSVENGSHGMTARKPAMSAEVVVSTPDASARQLVPKDQPEYVQNVRSATPVTEKTIVPGVAETMPGLVRTVRDQGGSEKPLDNKPLDAVKFAASSSAEFAAGENANESSGNGMNGTFQPHMSHQQIKTENVVAAGTPSTAIQSDPSRAVVPEQVVQQVKERLVNHEAKPGNDQIVLRLSPDHLGDLRVNLNMEGQKLRVEIVAENRMVRDALMQHTDTLKESLSRQNIRMESFDVTTGGNGAADSGRGQGEWRERAEQRQLNAWMPEGGYRLAKQSAATITAYQMKSEHSMVDVHF